MSSEWTITTDGCDDGGDENDGASARLPFNPWTRRRGAAYGAPRRHSRACSGIQRNKGNHGASGDDNGLDARLL